MTADELVPTMLSASVESTFTWRLPTSGLAMWEASDTPTKKAFTKRVLMNTARRIARQRGKLMFEVWAGDTRLWFGRTFE